MEFKEFNIHLYFDKDYGMGEKPAQGHVNGVMILFGAMLLVAGILLAVLRSTDISLVIAICLIIIGLALMLPTIFSGMKDNGKVDAWQAEYDHRKNTWNSEFDKFYQNKLDEMNLKQTAMRKIGITEEQLEDIQPFSIHGSVLKGAQNRFRIDANGVVRAEHNEVTWLFFSKDQIYLYNIKFRLTIPGKVEVTQEFFYKDIVSVSIATEHVAVDRKNCVGGDLTKLVDAEKIKLTVSGDSMSFVLPKIDEIVHSVQTMKNKIRDKKSSNPTNTVTKKSSKSKTSD